MFRPGLAVRPAELFPLDRPGARRVRIGQEVVRDELAAIDPAESVYDPWRVAGRLLDGPQKAIPNGLRACRHNGSRAPDAWLTGSWSGVAEGPPLMRIVATLDEMSRSVTRSSQPHSPLGLISRKMY